MKDLPERIIRLDDGAEFVLKDNGKYSMKAVKGFKGMWEYTYEQLMEWPQNKGYFKVVDGTEDLEAIKKDWLKRCMRHNDGHGEWD